MAIRKDKSSVFVKVVIIVVAISFVVTGVSVVLAPSAQSGTQQTTGQAGSIAAKHKPTVDAALAATKANPKDANAFIQLGNAYFDWAFEEQQAKTGAEQPIWVAAATAYKQAVALKPGDPNVVTDLAIAQFYSYDTSGAIATIEPVLKSNPEHANAAMNASIFYESANQPAKGVEVLQAFLAKNPKSPEASRFQTRVSELQKKVTSAPATGTAPATTTP